MPSFLSKVFGRKKDEKEPSNSKRHSTGSLLEGKFEAVSPTVSPTAFNFIESAQQLQPPREKDIGFSLFRPKSKTSPKLQDANKSSSPAPLLTLNLPVPKEDKSRALGVVFEADPNGRSTLSNSQIGDRRLTPLETLLLVKACATAIVERGGLESLGIMHPHWYSSSEEAQRRLISLFILSLASKSPNTTPSAPPSSPSLVFQSEIEYTRSPHDLAAVLRWALRHLRLEGNSFGKTDASASTPNADNANQVDEEQLWTWYNQFFETEKTSSYPVNAFSNSLVPLIPESHLQLLTATLDIITSLAAHAESNGSSGSKLTKFFGLWLLTIARSSEKDDWEAFYARWEKAGRILEHIFLAYIRDNRMPLRIEELVKGYPFNPSPADGNLFPRPRFSTRRYDALFVRLETQLPDSKTPKPRKQHPLRVIAEAFKADVDEEGNGKDVIEIWEVIKKAGNVTSPPGSSTPAGENAAPSGVVYPTFSKIFNEDTIRLLSLIPVDRSDSASSSPHVTPTSAPVTTTKAGRRRSSSLGSPITGNGKASNGNGTGAATPVSPSSITSPTSPTDWADFSSAGFGESSLGKDFASTLLDTDDVEVTLPPHSKKSSKQHIQQQKKRPTQPRSSSTAAPKSSKTKDVNRRSSSDNPRPLHAQDKELEKEKELAKSLKVHVKKVGIVELDEAFVDFWSDALLDPIASSWPTFYLCQLKSGVAGLTSPNPTNEDQKRSVSWLIVEHVYTPPPLPPLPPIPALETARPSSPKPSLKSNVSGRKSSTFSFASRRFSFLTRSDGNKSPTTPNTPSGAGTSSLLGGATKKKGHGHVAASPKVGEMGEILEDESSPVSEKGKKSEEPKAENKDKEEKKEVKGLGIDVVDSKQAVPIEQVSSSTTKEVEPVLETTQPLPVVSIQPPSVAESAASSYTAEGAEEESPEEPQTPTVAATPLEAIPSTSTDDTPKEPIKVEESSSDTVEAEDIATPEPVHVDEPSQVVAASPEPAHAEEDEQAPPTPKAPEHEPVTSQLESTPAPEPEVPAPIPASGLAPNAVPAGPAKEVKTEDNETVTTESVDAVIPPPAPEPIVAPVVAQDTAPVPEPEAEPTPVDTAPLSVEESAPVEPEVTAPVQDSSAVAPQPAAAADIDADDDKETTVVPTTTADAHDQDAQGEVKGTEEISSAPAVPTLDGVPSETLVPVVADVVVEPKAEEVPSPAHGAVEGSTEPEVKTSDASTEQVNKSATPPNASKENLA